jgi:hypothetical protein
MRRIACAFLLLSLGSFAAVAADEGGFSVKSGQDLKSVLKDQTGKVVSLRLGSGDDLTGTVVSVGDHLVHLSKLSGRDYYDAAVDLGDVQAIIVRARKSE